MRPAIVPALIAVTVLAGCSGTPATDASPNATDVTASASASAPPTATPDEASLGDGATQDGAAPDGTGDGATAGADPFCDPAQAGITATQALFEATDRKSTQTGVEDDGGDVGLMNAAGDDMLTHAGSARADWATARELVHSPAWDEDSYPVPSDDIVAAIDAYDAHMVTWVIPEAEIAASAGSIAEYDQATVALLADDEVIAAAEGGGEALGIMLGYTAERCGGIDALDG